VVADTASAEIALEEETQMAVNHRHPDRGRSATRVEDATARRSKCPFHPVPPNQVSNPFARQEVYMIVSGAMK